MRSRWLCSPPGGCGDVFLGRAGQGRALQRERCSLAWGGEQTGLICTADPTGCTSLSRTMTGYVSYLSAERFQTALRPLKSVLKQPAVCAVLAAPPPHPHVRMQAAGWEELPAPELTAQGAAWGAAGGCPGKQGAGEGAGQGLLQEPIGVLGLTSRGISVNTGTAVAEDGESPGRSRCSHAHLQRHCAACPQGAGAEPCG